MPIPKPERHANTYKAMTGLFSFTFEFVVEEDHSTHATSAHTGI